MSDRDIYADPLWVEMGLSRNRRFRQVYSKVGKRALDLAVAVPLALMFAPLIGILLILVALDRHNPLFTQERVGRRGRVFRCWKIRSMVPDAEERLAELLRSDARAAAEWGEHQKLLNDPRITRIGAVLRRTSLDELPQLWNVIRGEMSLVGPRPVLLDELQRYGDNRAEYMSVSPGLTGPWQVSGRNTISYNERVSLDAAYARYHSLAGDLFLIAATALAMVRRTGI